MMRVRFDLDGLAKKLGQTPEQVLKDLNELSSILKKEEGMCIRDLKGGDKTRPQLALICLAWTHCEAVQEG